MGGRHAFPHGGDQTRRVGRIREHHARHHGPHEPGHAGEVLAYPYGGQARGGEVARVAEGRAAAGFFKANVKGAPKSRESGVTEGCKCLILMVSAVGIEPTTY